MIAIARLVRTVAMVVAAILVVGIILRLVGANSANSIVSDIHDAGNWLAGPFRNIFTVKNAKEAIALNWGLAAVVYLIVGHLLASLLARAGAGRFGSARPVY
jgi:hypothetical protein